ncbi:hypothetical protein C8R43DRAFT_1205782 [Mycena crocata]|nr:hypothetical protein C8R43DRAFT_1205782 [Mycena crocata]
MDMAARRICAVRRVASSGTRFGNLERKGLIVLWKGYRSAQYELCELYTPTSFVGSVWIWDRWGVASRAAYAIFYFYFCFVCPPLLPCILPPFSLVSPSPPISYSSSSSTDPPLTPTCAPPFPPPSQAAHAVHARLVSWFLDTPVAPLGVHRMMLAGKAAGKDVGMWPSAAAGALRWVLFLLFLTLTILQLAIRVHRSPHHWSHILVLFVLYDTAPPSLFCILSLAKPCANFLLHRMLVDAFPVCGLGVSAATDGTLYQTEVFAASQSPAALATLHAHSRPSSGHGSSRGHGACSPGAASYSSDSTSASSLSHATSSSHGKHAKPETKTWG